MRVVYVTASLPFGPGEAFVAMEVQELIRRGHEVWVVPTLPRGDVLHDDAARLVARTLSTGLLSPRILAAATQEVARSPRAALATLSWVRRSRNARIFLKNASVCPKSLWLAGCLRRLRADHVHVHWAGTSATLAMLAAEMAGIRWSLTAHRWDIAEDNTLELKIDRACFVRAINGLGLSELRRRAGTGRGKLVLLHMGVPVPEEPAPLSEAGERSRVLMAANFEPVKGHRYILEAIRILRDHGRRVTLDLAGSGPEFPHVKGWVRELALDEHVRFLGVVPHSTLLARMGRREWDLVVLSSIETPAGEREGIPVILMEAMSFGIPVVATTVGGIPELLREGAGLLVSPGDAQALSDAMDDVLGNPSLGEQLAVRGRQRIKDEFDVASVVSELVEQFATCEPSRT
jgi:glycosyltransferase involved in cell wall biosynthesis